MNSQDLRNLQEAYLTVAENVSSGRGSRSRSGTGARTAPIAQRVTASQAAEKHGIGD